MLSGPWPQLCVAQAGWSSEDRMAHDLLLGPAMVARGSTQEAGAVDDDC